MSNDNILHKTLSAWGRPDFEAVLKQEIEQLGVDQLPLQQGLSTGNYALAEPITVSILGVTELERVIRVKAGIFFSSAIAGCSCADDPTPIDKIAEYCEIQLELDKATAATTVGLAAE